MYGNDRRVHETRPIIIHELFFRAAWTSKDCHQPMKTWFGKEDRMLWPFEKRRKEYNEL